MGTIGRSGLEWAFSAQNHGASSPLKDVMVYDQFICGNRGMVRKHPADEMAVSACAGASKFETHPIEVGAAETIGHSFAASPNSCCLFNAMNMHSWILHTHNICRTGGCEQK